MQISLARLVAAVAALTLAASVAVAGEREILPPLAVKPDAAPLHPSRQAANPCAQFGPGFARAAGTDTCVRIGGGISVGVGGSAGAMR